MNEEDDRSLQHRHRSALLYRIAIGLWLISLVGFIATRLFPSSPSPIFIATYMTWGAGMLVMVVAAHFRRLSKR